MQQYGIRRVSKLVTDTTQRLRSIVNCETDDEETTDDEEETDHEVEPSIYSSWLSLNLELIWARCVAHASTNKELLGDLGAKMWVACTTINKIIEQGQICGILLRSGGYDELEEIMHQRDNLIGIVDQSLSDIFAQIDHIK